MQPLIDAHLRRQLQERFRAWAWMGPVGNLAAALVWVSAIAGSGAARQNIVIWSGLMIIACVLMTVAYRVPASFRWVDAAGIPVLTLGSLLVTGLLWGSALWLDGAALASDKYVYGTIAVMLGLLSGSMVASSGIARITGMLLVPMALGTVAALSRDELWIEAVGLVVLTAIITPVQVDSAAGIRELLRLRLASEEAACRDPLTGLMNRRGLSEALDRMPGDEPVTVVFADVDRFKEVNDTHGHDIGDDVLCTIARRLDDDLPVPAIAARFGGDEFVVVIPNSEGSSEAVVQRLDAVVEHVLDRSGATVEVTLSVGVAQGCASDVEVALLTKADRRMFVAKRRKARCAATGAVTESVDTAAGPEQVDLTLSNVEAV